MSKEKFGSREDYINLLRLKESFERQLEFEDLKVLCSYLLDFAEDGVSRKVLKSYLNGSKEYIKEIIILLDIENIIYKIDNGIRYICFVAKSWGILDQSIFFTYNSSSNITTMEYDFHNKVEISNNIDLDLSILPDFEIKMETEVSGCGTIEAMQNVDMQQFYENGADW